MILYINITMLLLGGSLVFYSLSPYYSALGLVITAISGCSLLAQIGTSFLALILLLIYLGGMLVVFTYSSAVSADRFPSINNTTEVFILTFFILLWTTTLNTNNNWNSTNTNLNISNLTDIEGASYLFHQNLVIFFILAGYILLIALIVVLNVSRVNEETNLQPL
uniref:NADH-ubiquinone oxidoreductase chain 6 n=1 Tax=Hyocrinidae sp. TaxID=3078845 RepID=A0AA96S2J7_9ECHI|nr:NADH dehydrogenase subunit 6 [Hyocrinidae sp.]